MEVYIFECSTNKKRFGATQDPKGDNLPKDMCRGGKWKLIKKIKIDATIAKKVGIDEQKMQDDINNKGWHIGESAIEFFEKIVK